MDIEVLSLSPLYEDKARSCSSISQEESPHLMPNWPATWSWMSQIPKVWEIKTYYEIGTMASF